MSNASGLRSSIEAARIDSRQFIPTVLFLKIDFEIMMYHLMTKTVKLFWFILPLYYLWKNVFSWGPFETLSVCFLPHHLTGHTIPLFGILMNAVSITWLDTLYPYLVYLWMLSLDLILFSSSAKSSDWIVDPYNTLFN